MTSQLATSYSGQMVWAFGSTCPYWPSIVCASDSGEMENAKNDRKPSVHVKFCETRKSDWIHLDNVFEFTGYESYVAKKQSMKSILSEDEFNKAFDTANNEGWRRAVVQATFILSKDKDSRLGIFNTLNILNDISSELSKIASNITFEDANAGTLRIAVPTRRTTRRSLPSIDASSDSCRSGLPQITDGPPKGRALVGTRRSLPATTPAIKPSTKFEEFEKDLLTYQMDSHPKKILFQGTSAANICKMCCSLDDRNDGNLVKCSKCSHHVHSSCLNSNNDESYVNLSVYTGLQEQRKRSSIRINIENKVLCNECQPPPICFACKEVADTPLKQCDTKSCSRYYHSNCLDDWKQIEFVDSKLKCPLHVCHTCFSLNIERVTLATKFTFCVECPTVYHLDSSCIPAGTIILTQKQLICIRHGRESQRSPPKLNWCFRCGKKGNALIGCDSCPKAFHMKCLDSSEVSDRFSCESCANGNHPLYSQLIVAKYGRHPWWPAVIVPTFKVPTHMYDKPPKNGHKFCVRFFGDYTLAWVRRGAVHVYSKSEAAKFLNEDQKQANAFKEAANWFDKINNKDSNNNSIIATVETQPSRQPPQYINVPTLINVARGRQIKSTDEPCKCACSANEACGPESNCVNRLMCIECDPEYCPSGAKCKNQCFKRRVYPAVKVVFMDDRRGFGLVADEFISAGQLVIEYVGELITESEFERRKSSKQSQTGAQHHYFMTYSKGLYIDAEKKGNESRFVNHSCVPNCETQKWTVNKVDRLGYFALKDIEKGTEITTSYDFDRGECHQCFCGEKKCKGVIGSRNSRK